MNKTQTICRDCVFATYSNKVQNGCKLNRLKHFPRTLICDPIAYYSLDGFCSACRNSDWAKDKKDLVKELYKEIDDKVKFNCSICVDTHHTLKDIHDSLNSIAKQTKIPTSLHLIIQEFDSNIEPHFITDVVKQFCAINKISKWNVSYTKKDFPYNIVKILDKSNEFYTCILTAGTEIIETDLFQSITDRVNKDCERISMAEPEEEGWIIVQSSLYSNVYKNGASNIILGIKELAKEQQCQKQIIKI